MADRKLTQAEKDAIDEELVAKGASPWIIIDKSGKKFYELIDGKLKLMTGTAARAALGRGKKSRKVS